MIKLFDIYHILILVSIFVILLSLYLIFKNKSLSTKRLVVGIILWSNFALHFLKMFFPPYNTDFSTQFHKMTLENICAITTVIAPFIFTFLKKESPVHDYMFFIMFLGGFLGSLLATEPTNINATVFDCFRYFYCHGLMLVCCVLTQLFGIHRLKLKNIWIIPVGFLAYQTIIFLNELTLFLTGTIGDPRISTWEVFFDSNLNNNSFTFGPTPDSGAIGKILLAITPDFMKYESNGYLSCIPVLWFITPTILILTPIHFIISLPFTIKDFKKKGCK